ncbi:NACHT domain-containing protein [Streptomyces sp. NPDC047043]|uniref:NACHT domain-containing protein n=1 Tax=Streptomyces sp. NPDC047043 TaxID=3154497 RepID=UPI0033D8ACF0
MAGLGGRRYRRTWRLVCFASAAAIAASAVFVVWQIAHGGLQPADTAGLLGLPVGVAGLGAAVSALRKPIEGNDADLARGWAKTLARQIEMGEGEVRRQLLGADTRRINLAYALHPVTNRAAEAPFAGRTFTDASTSTLPDVLDYYHSTRPRRLVITGAAGAGKTVLVLELMLALIDNRADDDPVPVRIPLAQWDTRQPLTDLLVQRLTEAYDWPSALAVRLVEQGMVLPVLDGLDEMDYVRDDGTPDPHAPRALAVLEALNAYQDGRDAGPLVLTCRTDHYNALGPALQLVDAARIAIAPVSAGDAVTYLRGRTRDLPRWQPLLDHLQTHPTDPLAATLATPWRLCLAASVYHRTGNPNELLHHPTAHDLDQHLLARFIPAATANTPNPHRYPPDQVHRWLHSLTKHLTTAPSNPLPGTDLFLHRLWRLNNRRVRTTDAIYAALAVMLPLALVQRPFNSSATVATDLGIALFAVLAALTRNTRRLSRIDTHRPRTPEGLRDLAAAAGLGFLMCGAFGFAGAPDVGVVVGVTVGVVGGLAAGVQGEPTRAAMPRALIRDDVIAEFTIRLAVGMTFGGAFACSLFILVGLAAGPETVETTSLSVVWIAGGLAGWIASGGVARRYVIFLLWSRRRLPLRLARFLDWSCSAGLMRYSGPGYQFRHQELQQWLTQHPSP